MSFQVIDISRSGVFSLDEAKALVPALKAITEKYVQTVESKMQRLESLSSNHTELIAEIESEINEGIQSWHSKVRKLGGDPKGLWLVDLDSGHGCYCWKHPEPRLEFWHTYTEGFKGRMPIDKMPPPPENACINSVPEPKNVVSPPL